MAIFTVPFQWNDTSLINVLHNKNGLNNIISEVYGTISEDCLPHGRAIESVNKISKCDAIQYKKILDENNIKFAYLLNANEYMLKKNSVKNEIDWIVNDFKPDSITIASLELMEYVRNNYNNIKINISTIAGIKNVENLKRYEYIHPSKVVLHHDGNRNIKSLERLLLYAKEKNFDIELMVNESCLYRCSKRQCHYAEIAKGNSDRQFHQWCNENKITHPYLLLMANYILPNNITFYEKLGIKYFKITGRSKPVEWLNNVIEAYIVGNYSDNLMNILAIDPRLKAEKSIYINTEALEDFFISLLQISNINEQIIMCKKKIVELYQNKNFRISNKVDYVIKNNDLRGVLIGDIYESSL